MTWMTPLAKRSFAIRREQRELLRQGFRKHETDWEIHRGYLCDKVIVEARISVCGKYVYTKIGDAAALGSNIKPELDDADE